MSHTDCRSPYDFAGIGHVTCTSILCEESETEYVISGFHHPMPADTLALGYFERNNNMMTGTDLSM